jgi:NDP-sugar pyrophosphorylase family protein
MKNIWIIGASDFGCDVAIRFIGSPGEGNIFKGFIDDRLDVLERAKAKMIDIDNSLNYMTPIDHNFKDLDNAYLFGLSDPQFKASFFKGYILNKDRLHRFDQAPDLFQPLNLENGQYWNCNISGFTTVGYGCFIDAVTVIGHSVTIGNFCHIGVGVLIGGESKIGEACHIHSGAIIGRGVAIGDNSVVGCGAVVLRDLPDNSKVIAPKSISL